MNRKVKIRAIEAEIHGIELELSIRRPEHVKLTKLLEDLEAEKQKLHYELLRHKVILRSGGDNDQVA